MVQPGPEQGVAIMQFLKQMVYYKPQSATGKF